MTATVGDLISGQTYYLRTRNAIALVAQSKATASPLRKSDTAIKGKGRQ